MLNPGDVVPKRVRIENLVAALAEERIKTLEGLPEAKDGSDFSIREAAKYLGERLQSCDVGLAIHAGSKRYR